MLAIAGLGMTLIYWLEKALHKSETIQKDTKLPLAPGKTMKVDFALCNACIKDIGEKDSFHKHLYLDVCTTYVLRKETWVTIATASEIVEPLRYLENKGLVLTTEVSQNSLGVLPVGYHHNEEFGHLFCQCVEKHFPYFVEQS